MHLEFIPMSGQISTEPSPGGLTSVHARARRGQLGMHAKRTSFWFRLSGDA